MNIKIIGISSNGSGQGKDLLFKLLKKKLPTIKRFALADELKKELYSGILTEFGVNVFNCDRKEKDIIRPKLVSYGEEMRNQTAGRYWIDKISPKIIKYLEENPNNIACITDIRYENEVNWIKNELSGILVHIKRYNFIDNKKVYFEPPNDNEKLNSPILAKLSNYKIDWPTLPREELEIYADELIKYISR